MYIYIYNSVLFCIVYTVFDRQSREFHVLAWWQSGAEELFVHGPLGPNQGFRPANEAADRSQNRLHGIQPLKVAPQQSGFVSYGITKRQQTNSHENS